MFDVNTWNGFWFVKGGSIHGHWKYRRYTRIKDLAETLPKEAWERGRLQILEAVMRNIKEEGLEQTIDWVRSRAQYERDQIELKYGYPQEKSE